MDERSLVEGYIVKFGISLDVFEFLCFERFFPFFKKKNGFLDILGPPYHGIGATIRIGREMLCLLYVGFFYYYLHTLIGLVFPVCDFVSLFIYDLKVKRDLPCCC